MSKVVGGVIGFLAGGWLLIMVMSATFALFTDGGDRAGYIWLFLCPPVFLLGGVMGAAIGAVLAGRVGREVSSPGPAPIPSSPGGYPGKRTSDT